MAKIATNLASLSRFPLRLFSAQIYRPCKLCQESCRYIYSNNLVEGRHFSTSQWVCKQSNNTIAAAFGKIIPEKSSERLTKQEQYLLSEIEQGNLVTSTDWEALKTKTFEFNGFINSFNFDAIAMGFCITTKQYGVGISLLDHIHSQGQKANMGTLSRFLKLCHACHTDPVPKGVQEMILSAYSELKSSSPLMDANSAANTILALTLTEKWKEGIDLLSMIEISCVPSSSVYNALAKAAFDHDDIDLGWKLMNDALAHDRRIRPDTYCALLEYSERTCNRRVRHEIVENLLLFYAENDIQPTKDIAEKLRSWFKGENPDWKSSMTSVNRGGVCKNCKNPLESVAVTKEEYGALRSNFIDKVVVGSNIFLKTNPEELRNFQKFLERSVPYDVVIDGLNVAYALKKHNKNSGHSAYQLQTVVEHFLEKSQRVVLFGRKHMQLWPQRPMKFIFRNTRTFLAENISQDDPFLLYATIYGGLGTRFVSRDLMRSHLFLMKDRNLKAVFRRWQQQHQYNILYIADEGKVHIKPPLSYNPCVQRRADGGWHIPYDEEFKFAPPQTLEPPQHWLCLGPKVERKRAMKTE